MGRKTRPLTPAAVALGVLLCAAPALAQDTGRQHAGRGGSGPLLEGMSRRSQIYRRAVLRFSCTEQILQQAVQPGTGTPESSQEASYRYLLVSDPDAASVAEYREVLSRNGVPVRPSPVVMQTAMPPPFLWATLFAPENASLFRFEVLGAERRGVTDTVVVAFDGQIAFEDGSRLAEWSGRIWLDRDRLNPVHLEAEPARQETTLAAALERYRKAFRIGGVRLRPRPRAFALSVDFLVSPANGLTFPSQATWRRDMLDAGGDRRTERYVRRRFEGYRFLEINTEEILKEVVGSEPTPPS